jgi:hypothetical protein
VLLLAGAVLGLLAGLLTGGSLQNLVARRLRWPLVVIAAFAVKELLIHTPLGSTDAAPAIFTASLVLLIAWTLWHWHELPGIGLVALGMTMNLVVVALNGGHMPVVAAAAHLGPAQLQQTGVWAQYSLIGPDTRLTWLSDLVLFPDPLGRLFPQAYSPGDIVGTVGLTLVLFLATRPVSRPVNSRAITTP